MIYLGEQLGNIISNYHGIFIDIFMHGYYHIYQKKHFKPSSHIHARKFVSWANNCFNPLPKFLNFDTLYATVSNQIIKKTSKYLLVF